MGLDCVYTCVLWSPVLSKLWWRFLHKGCTVCGQAGPPAPAALPLPAWAYQATHPSALWDPALPQLVYLFLERGEAWVLGGRDWGHPQTLAILDASLFFQCSEACGGGEQQRLVTCPEPGLCEESLRPNSTRPCNTHPCTQWVVGPWGQVSGVPWGGSGINPWQIAPGP